MHPEILGASPEVSKSGGCCWFREGMPGCQSYSGSRGGRNCDLRVAMRLRSLYGLLLLTRFSMCRRQLKNPGKFRDQLFALMRNPPAINGWAIFSRPTHCFEPENRSCSGRSEAICWPIPWGVAGCYAVAPLALKSPSIDESWYHALEGLPSKKASCLFGGGLLTHPPVLCSA